TWSCKAAKVPWDSTHGEVSAIRLRNGKLLAATRRSVPGTRDGHGFGEMMLTESSDDGRTWAKPWSMSHTGEVHAYLTNCATAVCCPRTPVIMCRSELLRCSAGTAARLGISSIPCNSPFLP